MQSKPAKLVVPPCEYITAGLDKSDFLESHWNWLDKKAKRKYGAEGEDRRQGAAVLFLSTGKKIVNEQHGQAMLVYKLAEANRKLSCKYNISLSELEVAGWLPTSNDNVLAQSETEELHRVIIASMAHLSRICRLVVMLRYFADLSAKDVAQLLGVSQNNVYQREYAAHKILRKWLKKYKPCRCDDYGPLFM